MSAGLMSCVRENSPPLECPPVASAASSDGHGISHSSSGGGGPPGTMAMAGPGHGSMMLDPNDMPITITTPEHLQHLQHHHQHHQQGKAVLFDFGVFSFNLLKSFRQLASTSHGFLLVLCSSKEGRPYHHHHCRHQSFQRVGN